MIKTKGFIEKCHYAKAGQGDIHNLLLSVAAIATEFGERMAQEDMEYFNSVQRSLALDDLNTEGLLRFRVAALYFRGDTNYK